MAGQPGLFNIGKRLQELSAKGDNVGRLNTLIDLEVCRGDPELAMFCFCRRVPQSGR